MHRMTHTLQKTKYETLRKIKVWYGIAWFIRNLWTYAQLYVNNKTFFNTKKNACMSHTSPFNKIVLQHFFSMGLNGVQRTLNLYQRGFPKFV